MKKGSHHSPETKDRLRQASLGHKHSPGAREKCRQAQLGKVVSPQTRQKLREANLGNKSSLGHKQTPEEREKHRQATLRQWENPAFREKMRAHNLQNRLAQHFPLTDIERILRMEFRKRRLKFQMHKAMFGRFQPDFVFEQSKLVVQADGGFWHSRRHPRNLTYDAAFNTEAAKQGWTVFRFSDTEIKMNRAACARAVARFVRDHQP